LYKDIKSIGRISLNLFQDPRRRIELTSQNPTLTTWMLKQARGTAHFIYV